MLPAANEIGFNPKFQPLTHDAAKLFLDLTWTELKNRDDFEASFPDSELPFLSQIFKQRVEVLDLPVKLTKRGLLAVNCFAQRPGAAIVVLVDFLTKYEGQELTCSRLANLYPVGFYSEDSMVDLIDNYMKPKKVKWSELY